MNRFPRIWPLVVGGVIWCITGLWAVQTGDEAMTGLFRHAGLHVSVKYMSVNVFLQRDLYVGMPHLVCLLLCVGIGALPYRSHRPYGSILIWATLIWSGPAIWRAAVVLMNIQGGPSSISSTRWEDFGPYLADPLIHGGEAVLLIGALLLAAWLTALEVKRARKQDG